MGSLALRPGDSLAIPRMALSVGFRSLGFPPVCDSSYRAPDSCPGGTNSRWMRQPSLDALRPRYLYDAEWQKSSHKPFGRQAPTFGPISAFRNPAVAQQCLRFRALISGSHAAGDLIPRIDSEDRRANEPLIE